jgi:hypothetical protein
MMAYQEDHPYQKARSSHYHHPDTEFFNTLNVVLGSVLSRLVAAYISHHKTATNELTKVAVAAMLTNP